MTRRGADFRVSWCVSRCDEGGEIRLGVARGKKVRRRRRLLNADVEICRFCRACADHQASLIVSAESLYSLFTRSLNDSSCWNYCTHRGKGTRYSHLLHTFVLQRRTHLFRCSVPTEFTQAEVMSGSEWITEISECNLPPAGTGKGQCGANPGRANHRQLMRRGINPGSEIIMSVTRPVTTTETSFTIISISADCCTRN